MNTQILGNSQQRLTNESSLHQRATFWTLAQRGEEGQSVIEFSLVAALLFMLTFGMIDFGRAVYTSSVVQAAAQEGARAGIIPDADINAAIASKLAGLDPDRLTVNITPPDADNIRLVSVTYDFQFITPLELLTDISTSSIELEGTASMVSQSNGGLTN